MKKLTRALLIFFPIVSISCALAKTPSAPPFEYKLNTLIQQHLPSGTLGLVIQDPQGGKIIYDRRAEEHFYPASNTKLFTAAAALQYFGANFQFQTSVHAQLDRLSKSDKSDKSDKSETADKPEKPEAGTLKDNLYLTFRGDPSFTIADLAQMIKQIKTKGIHKISGDFVIDDTAFQAPAYAPGWTWESIPYSFSAPITTIVLNENKVRLKFNKAEKLNEKLNFEQESSSLPLLKLKQNVIAVTQNEAEHLCQFNPTIKQNEITLVGCWPKDKTPSHVELALDDPRALAQRLITSFLTENNIELEGSIRFAAMEKPLPAIIIKRSVPLKNLLPRVLADSNNLYTESLTKALGVAYFGQGTFQAGINAINEILSTKTQLSFADLRLNDGSGQSRYNLVTPLLVTQLLYHLYQDPDFNVFYQALSTSGKNGSLAMRMKSETMSGKVVAKTGTASGTSALSGYLTANSGKQYIFSMMINQAMLDHSSLKSFENKLCELMVQEPWLARIEDSSVPGLPTEFR